MSENRKTELIAGKAPTGVEGAHFSPGQICLSAKSAAIYLGYAEKTLANWRVQGNGPLWFQNRAKGKVLYPVSELDRWQAAHLRQSTSDKGGRHGE